MLPFDEASGGPPADVWSYGRHVTLTLLTVYALRVIATFGSPPTVDSGHQAAPLAEPDIDETWITVPARVGDRAEQQAGPGLSTT